MDKDVNDAPGRCCPVCGGAIVLSRGDFSIETTLHEKRCGHCDALVVICEEIKRSIRVATPSPLKVGDLCMARPLGYADGKVKEKDIGPVKVVALSVAWNGEWWATWEHPTLGSDEWFGSQPASELRRIE